MNLAMAEWIIGRGLCEGPAGVQSAVWLIECEQVLRTSPTVTTSSVAAMFPFCSDLALV